MSAETLKPCPFCGGEAKPDFFQSSYRIACLTPQCPASGGYLFDSEDRAIEAWNRRSQPQEEEPVGYVSERDIQHMKHGHLRCWLESRATGLPMHERPVGLYRHRNPISEG